MKAVLLLLIALGAADARPFGYEKGKRYTHQYECEVTQSVPGGSAQIVGLRTRCQAHLDALNQDEYLISLEGCQLTQLTESKNHPTQNKEEALHQDILTAMQQKLHLPVKAVFEDDHVKEIQAEEDDDEWSQNIKRGLVNLLQISVNADQLTKDEKQFFTQQETTTVGKCEVAYAVSCDKQEEGKAKQERVAARVSKVINYEKCKTRPQLKQSIYYPQKCNTCEKSPRHAPYHRSTGNIDHLLMGSAQAGFTIQRTEAVEEHIITPYSDKGGHVMVRSRQCLQFTKFGVVKPITKPLSKKLGQMFVPENPVLRWRANSVYQNQLVTKVCAMVDQMAEQVKQLKTLEAAETFACLVQKLRHCNKETCWKKVAGKMLAQTDSTVRKLCLDAWSYVGTIEAFEALQENVEQQGKCEPELRRLFLGLPFSPDPTAKHLKISWKLCQHHCVKKDFQALRNCMLGFGAMAQRILQQESHQQDTKTITVLQDYIQEILHKLASKTATEEEKAMYVKTLGNAGHPQALGDIKGILKDRNQPLHLRMECVWALRRIIPQTREKIHASLISTFADATESPELRMALFVTVLDTEATFFAMQALANIVRQELSKQTQGQAPGPQSNQVASFVTSHLRSLAYQHGIMTKRRSINARMVLRLLPRMSFGLSYSIGGCLAGFAERFQTGAEVQANVIRVPQSMFPRNVNAKLQFHVFGHRINALEVGSRVENLDNVLDDILSEIHSRHKRSLIGSIMSWFSNDQPKGAQGPPRETKQEPLKGSTKGPGDAPAQDPNDQPKKPESRRASCYLKLFGDELGFLDLKKDDFDKLTVDVVDILLGRKKRVEYANKGIVISKNGIEVHAGMEKALFTSHAQQIIPTLCGIPLDLCVQTTAVVKVNVDAVAKPESSLLDPFNFKKMTVAPEIKLSAGGFVCAQVGIHTPFYQVGLKAQRHVHVNPGDKITFGMEFGKEYNVTYNIPQNERDIIRFHADARGFICEMNPKTFIEDKKDIDMHWQTHHLTKIDLRCYGGDLLGVQICTDGQTMDVASRMLPQFQIFPTVEMTKWRFTMAPSTDKPSVIHYTSKVTKNDATGVQSTGVLTASSSSVARKIPHTLTYTRPGQGRQEKLEIECCKIEAPECTNCMAKVTAQPVDMKHWIAQVAFGEEGAQNQATLEGRVDNDGKYCYLEARWTKIPEEWRTYWHVRELQAMQFFQQFSVVKRSEAQKNRVALELMLTSPRTADMCLKTPTFDADRRNMYLPLRVDCFPSSLAEIKNSFYGRCVVQQNRIKMFDRLVIEHSLVGKCGYVLAQDHRQEKKPRIRVVLKVDEKGQKTLIALLQNPAAQNIQIGPGLTIQINGQKMECQKQACKLKNGAVTVRKVQRQDGRTQIQLSTAIGLYASVNDQQIELYTSPLLRNRVRGLCGDRNGEQYREFKDPEEHVQKTQTQFIESWKHQC